MSIRNIIHKQLFEDVFKKSEDFSITEIKQILNITDNLTENSKTDIDMYSKACQIVNDIAKAYMQKRSKIIQGQADFDDFKFDVDGITIEYEHKEGKPEYTSDPKHNCIYAKTDIWNPFTPIDHTCLIHEIIHCLDAQRVRDEEAITHANGKIGSDYYSSPLEYNAFTNELFNEVIQAINKELMASGQSASEYFLNKNSLANVLNAIITNQAMNPKSLLHDFLTSLPEDKLRRIFNRLYGVVHDIFFENLENIIISNDGMDMQILIESILTKGK